jgi:hypothetical protein
MRLFRELAVALKDLPISGKSSVEEPGGGGFVAGELRLGDLDVSGVEAACHDCDKQEQAEVSEKEVYGS